MLLKNFLIASTTLFAFSATAFAQPAAEKKAPASIAVEADALAYALPGYSAIVNVTTRNKIQLVFGTGRYDVPSFMLKGDKNYDAMKWKAKVSSLELIRVGYRFKGAMKSGPVVGAVMLNQNFRLSSERVAGEARFHQLSVGPTAGYYIHVGKHFYIYPTGALTYNTVTSGGTSVGGVNYHVKKFGPTASVHVGWEWGF